MFFQKQKNRIIVFLSVLVAVSILIYCKVATTSREVSVLDLSDIEQMNIGSEMPKLLYADKKSAIMQGTFGIVVYSFNNSKVTDRISQKQLKSYGLVMPYATVFKDGSAIYIRDHNKNGAKNLTYLKYSISTGVMKKISQQPVDLFTPILIKTPGYNEQYDKYFDFHYLINDTIVEVDNSFIYLRANSDWSMKSLQIIICQYSDSTSNVYNVF